MEDFAQAFAAQLRAALPSVYGPEARAARIERERARRRARAQLVGVVALLLLSIAAGGAALGLLFGTGVGALLALLFGVAVGVPMTLRAGRAWRLLS